MLTYYTHNYSYCYDYHRMMVAMFNMTTHKAFVHSLVREPDPKAPTPKSISVLTRAINRARVPHVIRQPCWRAGRWKSLT